MEEKTRVKVVPAEAGRVAMARLQRDTDLVTGIIEVCREAGFEMAASQLIIGSLRRAEISWTRPSDKTKRGSERTPAMPIAGPLELISAQAEVCLTDPERPVFHVHGVVTDADGKAWGGHFFKGGNPVHATVDIVMNEIKGGNMKRTQDDENDLELPFTYSKKKTKRPPNRTGGRRPFLVPLTDGVERRSYS